MARVVAGCVVIGLAAVSGLASAMVGTQGRVESAAPEAQAKPPTAPANGGSLGPSISAHGRFVAFSSDASNLVAGDTNGCYVEGRGSCHDVFVRDRVTGTTARVSMSSSGKQANDDSRYPAISANGRFVTFSSGATNLYAVDTNETIDLFLHNRARGTTTRVNVGYSGATMSADGRFVAFSTGRPGIVAADTNDRSDVFVLDRVAGRTTLVSGGGKPANGDSSGAEQAAISGGGGVVAFVSDVWNPVAGGGDVFVRDRAARTTERVSTGRGGKRADHDSWGPAISADGRFVAFSSIASNLVVGDTNRVDDVFVRDRVARITTRVSVSSRGRQAAGLSEMAAISARGRFVAFSSDASNLVAGDTNRCEDEGGRRSCVDVFVRDRVAGTTTRVSVSSSGKQANHDSESPVISADGRFVAFSSRASNLVAGDTNDNPDVFVRDRVTGTTALVSVGRS